MMAHHESALLGAVEEVMISLTDALKRIAELEGRIAAYEQSPQARVRGRAPAGRARPPIARTVAARDPEPWVPTPWGRVRWKLQPTSMAEHDAQISALSDELFPRDE